MDGFDRFVAQLDQAVLVVTARDRTGERAGCLVGFATQCSIDPPRLLVCLSKVNRTYRVAQGADLLAVHSVPEEALDVARLFAEETGDEIDKFTRCSWQEGPDAVPLLVACPDRIVGRVGQRIDVGDHVAHLLEPLLVEGRSEGRSAGAILRYGDVASFHPGHPA